jgi:hypothetical protein
VDSSLDPIQFALQFVETVREPFVVLDDGLRVRHANGGFFSRFELDPRDVVGRPFAEIGDGQWCAEELGELLTNLKNRDVESVSDFAITREFENLGVCSLVVNARRIPGPASLIAASATKEDEGLILVAFEDVT